MKKENYPRRKVERQEGMMDEQNAGSAQTRTNTDIKTVVTADLCRSKHRADSSTAMVLHHGGMHLTFFHCSDKILPDLGEPPATAPPARCAGGEAPPRSVHLSSWPASGHHPPGVKSFWSHQDSRSLLSTAIDFFLGDPYQQRQLSHPSSL